MDEPIGIFDSGIGGVTVLKEIVKILPKENYIYYSDSANNPYGDKKDSEIIEICDKIVNKLINEKCKAIVIACNTASAKASKYLREKYKNIPIIAIEPAYKMVYDNSYEKPTLVMATKGTIESEKFNLLFKKYNNHKTYLLPCIGLADIIESGDTNKIKNYLNKNLGIYKNRIENVVLGCTHYPLIKKEIMQSLGDEIQFFDGATSLARHLKNILEEKEMLNKKKNKNQNIIFIDTSTKKDIRVLKEKRFYEYLKKDL